MTLQDGWRSRTPGVLAPGRLAIVGVGPGDPELLTVKAARLIKSADLITYFAKHDAPGHARTIADRYITPGAAELRLAYPVTTELDCHGPDYRRAIDDFHAAAAAGLAQRLAEGAAIVLLCEGDPFFFGSAMHLFDRLRDRADITVVPGVSAMSGAWSGALAPIAHGDDRFTVIPATLPDDALEAALASVEAAVVMKLGRNLPRVRRALERLQLLDRTIYVEHATAAHARTERLAERDPAAPAPYFSLLLIPGRRNAR